MAKKKRSQDEQPKWKGQAVEAQPGDDAERAADRVEGNEPVRADAEARRLNDHGDVEPQQRRSAPGTADPEGETADAAEEHRDRQAAEGYPPRGKL
jgi:hypothetical protein